MLKAEGRVYTLGDRIGLTTRYVKDIEVLRNAITSDTVPLVSTFDQPLGAWNLTQPIGRAELEIRGDSIYAKLTFNEQSSDIYKDALDNGYNAKLGFHAVRCDVKDDIVNSMSIIACGVSDTCLGGVLEGIRNED